MRKQVLSLVTAAVLVLVLAAPAGAAKRSTTTSITSVQPVLVRSGTDACGPYCEYRAAVTLSWNGTTRLWVSHVIDGVRRAPGEVTLTGSGTNKTVWVDGIRGEPGSGPIVAEAFVLARRTWTAIASGASDAAVTCAPAS